MPYTISFLEDEGIVLIENIGALTHTDFVNQSQEALELGRVKKMALFLSDCTRLIGKLTTLELFVFPAMYTEIGTPRTNKVTVLMSEDPATNKDFQFYETVCKNRGWQVRVFTIKDGALEWLLG